MHAAASVPYHFPTRAICDRASQQCTEKIVHFGLLKDAIT